MSHTDEDGEPIPIYALRLTQRAQRDLDATTVHLAETASPEAAIAWREGFYEGLAALATFPRRCPLAPERFRREVRQWLYRRPGSQMTYRNLFVISGEEENGVRCWRRSGGESWLRSSTYRSSWQNSDLCNVPVGTNLGLFHLLFALLAGHVGSGSGLCVRPRQSGASASLSM